MAEHFPLEDGRDWRVMAADISTEALVKARAGVSPLEPASAVPKPCLKKFCHQAFALRGRSDALECLGLTGDDQPRYMIQTLE